MNRYRFRVSAQKLPSSHKLPWLVLLFLVALLLLLSTFTYWRSSGVGPQVQVPMFYDAHYLYPRPWTQEQSAPGVPEPAPVALYGPNAVSQSFIAGSDNLAAISFALTGPEDAFVNVSLSDEYDNTWAARINSPSGFFGEEYSISFPPQEDSNGHRYTLILTSPKATAEQPVIVRSVGGDRLDGTFRLNEFIRPGNLAITTYSRGVPGRWWLDSIGEQLLPEAFRLRLQQYKAAQFKGDLFSWLLLITVGLSAVLLVLASPDQQKREQPLSRDLLRSLGWFLVIFLGSFLIWQVGSGRVNLLAGSKNVAADTVSTGDPPKFDTSPRVIADLANDLWTAVREPEARFVKTDLYQRYPAIRVPGESSIHFALTVPPDSHLRLAQAAEGEGVVEFSVAINDQSLISTKIDAVVELAPASIAWQELDLAPWAGQGIVLTLNTSLQNGDAGGLWLMPQIITDASWLSTDLPDAYLPSGVHFNDTAELLGVVIDEASPSDELAVQLLWRPLQATDQYGKIFIHLIDGSGQLIAQHDGPPVNGAYPFAIWQPGIIIQDDHLLQLDQDLSSGPYRLEIGIYDPDTLQRWTAESADGTLLDNRSAALHLPPEVLP